MPKVLIVEDDQAVCEMLQLFLQNEQYTVVVWQEGTGVIEIVHQEQPDCMLLDWMLPGKNGLTILKEIRAFSMVPIIMLTAKDTDAEQVLGLETGADDYVTKPFSPFTLLARIKAVLRRSAPIEKAHHIVQGNDYIMDLDTFEVVLQGKKIEHLTAKEFQLLSFLAEHEKQVFSREQLIERIWGFDFVGDDRTVDAHIKRLRKKIHTPSKSWIHTVWGIGYKFDEDVLDEI
ncbi:response regulator transcription factor [Massilibacterium senegalense]|uniref:response regulator transcription factor n=1 Tax=Massilibacterium senegalense TaxID=1632858 RepID=UPI00093FE391|nr:response regulator transcription factor [Massilibacterium senegalense]